MKFACLATVTIIVLVNVIVCLRQSWVLLRKKIYQCRGSIVVSRVGGAEEWQDGRDKLAMFWPEVVYEYDLGSGKLTGNRISMAFRKSSNRAEVEKIISVYRVGKEVKLFYNPDDVTETYLKNPKRQISTFLLIALGMAVFGALMDWMIWVVVT